MCPTARNIPSETGLAPIQRVVVGIRYFRQTPSHPKPESGDVSASRTHTLLLEAAVRRDDMKPRTPYRSHRRFRKNLLHNAANGRTSFGPFFSIFFFSITFNRVNTLYMYTLMDWTDRPTEDKLSPRLTNNNILYCSTHNTHSGVRLFEG